MKIHYGIIIIMCCLLNACQPASQNPRIYDSGISQELAELRKQEINELKYDLRLSIPKQKSMPVEGEIHVRFRLNKAQEVILDFREEADKIKEVSANGLPTSYEFRNEHIILPKNTTQKGENDIYIRFTAGNQSLNRNDEFLYTLLVPDRARTVFPCFEQPNLKASFTLQLDIPSEWVAVSNTYINKEEEREGRKSIYFAPTEPLSTYLFSFVAGKLEKQEYKEGSRKISAYYRETDPKKLAQLDTIFKQVMASLHWLEDYTGVSYPFAKYDFIILPGFQYGGMEHTGATLYNDNQMFLSEHPTPDEELRRTELIAHETAHMWFGDLVTMNWFDDVWTKEVFANYFASRIVEPLYPDVNHRLNFIRDYIPASYSEDRTSGANPIKQDLDNLRNAGLVYGNIIYDKSPVVMEMLVRVLGEEAFQQGIREYLTTYAYGNATWEGLIRILNKYTEEDLAAWSEVWVNQKGMPEITASVKDGELVVEQRDPLGRGLKWPQELTYRVICGTDSEEIPVSLEGNSDSFRMKLSFLPNGNCVILPNTNGRGYGFFKITEGESSGLWSVLRLSEDEVLKGSLLITLYENLRWKTISPQGFRDEMLAYLTNESNSLLFSMALSYLGDCQRIFPSDSRPLEEALWRIVTTNPVSQHRLQAFRLYRSIADSEEAVQRLYTLWQERKAPKDCALSESDYIGLSYILAIHLPEKADKIIATQLSRIQNPDRKKEYQFISPSVSPRKAERDSVFASLLIAGNRRVEPWASSALAHLNHRLREQESVAYIRPALEAMPEVQRTGDIFFPTAWVRSLLSAHTSKEAREEVDAFFTAHPDFPLMLSNKIKQQASHLY